MYRWHASRHGACRVSTHADILLIPTPRHIRRGEGSLTVPPWFTASVVQSLIPAADAIVATGRIDTYHHDWASILTLSRSSAWCGSGSLEHLGYTLDIRNDTPIALSSPTAAGLRAGLATLNQLLRQFPAALPAITITDSPSLANRGVMLDVSRDRIPTMSRFREIIDDLALLKINHLQLYTEHTFAYAGHRTVWDGWSPITPAELIELDNYAHARGIELAANQNCFGHLRQWLRHPEYAHLAETHGDWIFDVWKRSGPFSLCPTDPASLRFVRDLLSQLTPCVRSSLVNIGCDETYDVGFGRSKSEVDRRGRAAVCLDFMRGVNDIVRECGKRSMYWADVPLSHPELLSQMPKDMIALAWGYEPSSPFDDWAEKLSRLPQGPEAVWLCPGTSSWRSIAGRTTERRGNIAAAANAAHKHGVSGMLVCDWGDTGHWQQWPVSMLGIAHGAHAMWRADTPDDVNIAALSLHALHDPSKHAAAWLERLGDADLALRETCLALAKPEQQGRLLNQSAAFLDLFKKHDELAHVGEPSLWHAAADIARDLERARPSSGNASLDAELAHTARFMSFVTHRASLRRQPNTTGADRAALATGLSALREEHTRLWNLTARPGGLADSLSHFDTVAALL
jgi:hexosaminidase